RIAKGDIQALMARTRANEIPEAHLEIYKLGDISDIYADARLKVRMTDGREFEGSRNRARGDWRLPLDMDEFWTKYRTCAREVLSEADTETTIALLQKLEDQPDLKPIMGILAGSGRQLAA